MEFLIENRELIDAALVAVLIIIGVLGFGVSYLIISKKEKNEKKRKVEYYISIDATGIITNILGGLHLLLELIVGNLVEEKILVTILMVLFVIVTLFEIMDLKEEFEKLSDFRKEV